MEMKDLSCAQFLAQLASKAPTPGGGGTAALAGAAGVALGNMVGCLTTGKKKYAAVEADIQALNARASALRLELEALVQADADAFAPLAAAYGLPKDTPEQAAHKAAVLEAALDGASAVPLQIMEKCADLLPELFEDGTKHFLLAHLSRENNTPDIARQTAVCGMQMAGVENAEDYILQVAPIENLTGGAITF